MSCSFVVCTRLDSLWKLPVFPILSLSLVQERVPFAVIGSSALLSAEARKVRGRQYPWGVAEGEWCGIGADYV